MWTTRSGQGGGMLCSNRRGKETICRKFKVVPQSLEARLEQAKQGQRLVPKQRSLNDEKEPRQPTVDENNRRRRVYVQSYGRP